MSVTEGDILKVVIEFLYPGASTALNVFHFVFGGLEQENEDILESIAAWVTDTWAPPWQDLADDNSEINAVDVTKVDAEGLALEDIGREVVNLAGNAVGGDVVAAGVAAYIQASTSVPGVYGRKYIPGLIEDEITNGLLNAGALVNLGLLGAAYVTPAPLINGGTIFPAVISKKTGTAVLLQPLFSLEQVPAYQRRRKVGVGS